MAQLAIAWVLSRGDACDRAAWHHPAWRTWTRTWVPTRWRWTPATLQRLDALINRHTVSGARYNPATQAEVDTEDYAG